MFDHLFENRNRTVTNLLKLSDCLGRSLRENIELFAIDSEKSSAAFLTEGGKVISGEYNLGDYITLASIDVQDMDVFADNQVFDNFVNEQVTNFVGSVNSNDYSTAEQSFGDILSLWENRLKFDTVRKNLEEKVSVFSESQRILETSEFQQFMEIMPQFVEFLIENKEKIESYQEINNSIKLSNSVANAFNFPKITYDKLTEEPYTVVNGINESVYDLICKSELVQKELLESKKSFDNVWATNRNVRQLASLLFEKSDDKVLEQLVECVVEVPYLTLATKKQLFECLDNAIGLDDHAVISESDMKAFASRLFEMKKPMKTFVINLLNEKYGINVQNLKETASFNGLATTQTVIFESLSRLSPKGSLLRECLASLGKMLKSKNGVEVIDVNDILQETFSVCGYSLEDPMLVESISFAEAMGGDETAATLLEKAKEKLLLDKNKKKLSKAQSAEMDTDKDGDIDSKDLKALRKAEDHPSNKTGEEDDSENEANEKRVTGEPVNPKDIDGDGDVEDDDMRDAADLAAKDQKRLTASKKKKNEETDDQIERDQADREEEDEKAQDKEEGETGQAEDKEPLTKEEFMQALNQLDDLMKTMDDSEGEEDKG